MRIGAFQINVDPAQLDEPHCIASLRPWINVGNVGRTALRRMASISKARRVGDLARPSRFYDYTRYRPRIRMVNGERSFSIPNTSLWAAKVEGGQDMLFLHMLEPQAFSEDFNESVLQLLRTFGATRYTLVGSMYDSVPHTRPLKISGAARGWQPNDEFQRAVRLNRSSYQGPTSFVSQLTEEIRKRLGLETLSMIVHLPTYLKLDNDYAGAASVLTALTHIYGVSTDEMPELVAGSAQYRQIGMGNAIDPRLQEVIKKFEADYDEEQDAREAEMEDISTASEQDSEPVQLLPEVEEFLQDVSRQIDDIDADDADTTRA